MDRMTVALFQRIALEGIQSMQILCCHFWPRQKLWVSAGCRAEAQHSYSCTGMSETNLWLHHKLSVRGLPQQGQPWGRPGPAKGRPGALLLQENLPVLLAPEALLLSHVASHCRVGEDCRAGWVGPWALLEARPTTPHYTVAWLTGLACAPLLALWVLLSNDPCAHELNNFAKGAHCLMFQMTIVSSWDS